MTTPSRLAANAANAQLSTGPSTPEGKARSSRNALTHGLTARDLVLPAADREEYDALRAALLDDLQPQGALELELFDQLLHAAWNLRRVRRLEVDLSCGRHGDRLSDDALDATFNRYARYHARFERSFYRALKELRVLQSARALRQPEAQLPALAAPAKSPKRTQIAESPAPFPYSPTPLLTSPVSPPIT